MAEQPGTHTCTQDTPYMEEGPADPGPCSPNTQESVSTLPPSGSAEPLSPAPLSKARARPKLLMSSQLEPGQGVSSEQAPQSLPQLEGSATQGPGLPQS